jgi:hypothetical protein
VRAHGLKWGIILLMSAPGRGIIRRAIEDIFAAIEHEAAPHSKFLVRASYLQIYNEVGARLPRCSCTEEAQLLDLCFAPHTSACELA